MSVLYDDVQMEQLTARNTKVLIFMRSLDIYDSINKPSGLWFILTQLSIGRNEYGKSGRLCIFTSLKHLMCFWGEHFQGFIFIHYQRHW